MKATFENTVDILVKAYLNDTLKHGSFCQCAVGNLIQHYLKKPLLDPYKDNIDDWSMSIYNGAVWYSAVSCKSSAFYKAARKQLAPTGYSFQEILKIERAFEKGYGDIFNALMLVVDVLADIHGIDLTQKENAKALFVKM